MANVQASLRASVRDMDSPARVCSIINVMLCDKLAFTLTLPVRRSRFVAARAIVGFAELSALALVPTLLLPIFAAWSNHSYPSIPQALKFAVLWIACGALFFAFGLLVSTFVPGDYPAAAACLVSLFAYLIVLEIAPLERFPSLDLFNVVTAWHMPYFSGRDTCFVTYLPWLTIRRALPKIDAILQRQNLHKLSAGRIRPNAERPASAHHLFFRKPGTSARERLVGIGAQTAVLLARTSLPP